MRKVTTRQLIRTNAVFGGKPKLANALSYAVSRANNEKTFFRKLAFLVRSMTSDHSFIDGNKRTALTIVLSELRAKGFKVDRKKLIKTIRGLAMTGEGNITKIERKLRKCTKK